MTPVLEVGRYGILANIFSLVCHTAEVMFSKAVCAYRQICYGYVQTRVQVFAPFPEKPQICIFRNFCIILLKRNYRRQDSISKAK